MTALEDIKQFAIKERIKVKKKLNPDFPYYEGAFFAFNNVIIKIEEI